MPCVSSACVSPLSLRGNATTILYSSRSCAWIANPKILYCQLIKLNFANFSGRNHAARAHFNPLQGIIVIRFYSIKNSSRFNFPNHLIIFEPYNVRAPIFCNLTRRLVQLPPIRPYTHIRINFKCAAHIIQMP